jgi:glycosyltransferase involved in cell wall biosynthesis
MTTLLLLNSLSVGGSERKSVRIVNEFLKRGNSISLAYLCGPDDLLRDIDGRIPTACLYRTGKFSLNALRNLRRFVTQQDISVILCMNQYPLLYAAALKRLLGPEAPTVILAVNTTDFQRKRDRWFMRIYAPLIRRTQAVIYGCKHQMELWQGTYNLKKAHSLVIYNGVDTSHFYPGSVSGDLRDRLKIANKFVVGCVGRLDPEKNQTALLEVVAGLHAEGVPIALLLVGDGPERKRLENLAASSGIQEAVHFLGRTDDVRSALASMDVFVLPSMSVETFSNAALEAMAMSLPVVLSDIGGAAEMVTSGENGYLYERHDKARLASLLSMLNADPKKREQLGQRARETVLTRFAFGRMIEDYERMLERLG